MKLFAAYSRRYERKRRLLRALRRSFDLTRAQDRTAAIAPGDILLFAVVRNEAARLGFWLDYYRRLGVAHFLIVDNASDDGSAEMLMAAPDVSLWTTEASYRRANFGVDWINALAWRRGVGHWILVVDPDEYLVYPHCDTRDLPLLTEHLAATRRRSLGVMLLDLYGASSVQETECPPGADPVAAAPFFDAANYFIRRDERYRNLWIQGGPRLRAFFVDRPGQAPALNKIPLVNWRRGDCFVSSTHALLPRALNVTYDEGGGERLTGVLLHAKFLSTLAPKVQEELRRREHFADGREYRAYASAIAGDACVKTAHSARFEDWRGLVDLGLMARGGWL